MQQQIGEFVTVWPESSYEGIILWSPDKGTLYQELRGNGQKIQGAKKQWLELAAAIQSYYQREQG